MAKLEYEILAQSGRARRGRLTTRKGVVDTPTFMPVGTVGSVKSLTPSEVSDLGAGIILGNTYHLLLRPGADLVAEMGGLHRFMGGWSGSILTDSGGFQVFSLASRRKVTEEGVSFRSHLDGALMELTPEKAMDAQTLLGSDIMMALDECPPPDADREYAEKALLRDARWAKRAKNALRPESGALFGIVQGGMHKDLRAKSAELICELDLPGHSLGGLSVGEPKETMLEVIDATQPLMPRQKPLYLMGVGAPEDLINCVGLGIDMFDCVLPTRMARTGTMLTKDGRLNLRNARFARDKRPIEEDCGCPACRNYSRAYLRHLFAARELLAYRLGTLHNLYFTLNLMARIRKAIENDNYAAFAREALDRLSRGEHRAAADDH
jgi:queuine tRNA-ribosyltransferase